MANSELPALVALLKKLLHLLSYGQQIFTCVCELQQEKGNTLILFTHVFRLSRYQQFKDFHKRILVATNLFGRGMDIERVNVVFNYDMPDDSDMYLHRVRFYFCCCLFFLLLLFVFFNSFIW